ncbi:MAG: hypothetical protein EBT20_06430 [Alphaproteobacteria bacterium]|nr:hypothetical protein [Alphaproteobacteria bacterium]
MVEIVRGMSVLLKQAGERGAQRPADQYMLHWRGPWMKCFDVLFHLHPEFFSPHASCVLKKIAFSHLALSKFARVRSAPLRPADSESAVVRAS